MGVRLTMRGRSQARQAARTVADLVPHGTPTIASDQKRAVQTARPIARVLGVQVMTDPRLREQGLGAMEGHTADELEPLPSQRGYIRPTCDGPAGSRSQMWLSGVTACWTT